MDAKHNNFLYELSYNESIVTRNISHFKRIPDLNVIKW